MRETSLRPESHDSAREAPPAPGWPGLLLRAALVSLIAILTGIAVLLAVAAATSEPIVFFVAGLAAFCLVNGFGLLLATRRVPAPQRSRVRRLLFVSGTLLITGLFAWTALRPLGDPRLPSVPVVGMDYWELPTGSRIAYVHVPHVGVANSEPVVFLHGGPGVPDMAGDSAYFGQLSSDGFDIYVYDQVGRGRSGRLADPRDYTLERDVQDLEAIRQQIGADRIILIGHSDGATLAAAYAAAHPDHVSRLILSSPGDPSPSAGGASMTSRLGTREQLRVYTLLLQPRALLGYTLLQVNPDAAHAFAGDAELDARFDRIYNRMRPALHCDGQPPGPELHGLGFYAHYTRYAMSAEPHDDFMSRLVGSPIPTLILKGRCDYVSWSSAQAYRSSLPEAQLIYLDHSGHNAYQDEPERFMANVQAFLLRQPLPDSPYEATKPPADFEGPD